MKRFHYRAYGNIQGGYTWQHGVLDADTDTKSMEAISQIDKMLNEKYKLKFESIWIDLVEETTT